MHTSNGIDVLIVFGVLVLMFLVGLILEWRVRDRDRRMERLEKRGLA
jgi:hypothetical protein